MKGRIAGAVALVAMSMTVAAGPAAAQTKQDGLVNLSLSDTNIQVPIGIAANICGVSANVLAASTLTGPVDCEAIAGAEAQRQGGGGSNNTKQSGLVNISLTDTNVQLPIAIAANVCGISVNVLSSLTGTGPVDCEVQSWSKARNK